MIFVWFSSGPRCPIKSILICQIESAVNANVYKHLICEQVHYENARNNIARGICVEVEMDQKPAPPHHQLRLIELRPQSCDPCSPFLHPLWALGGVWDWSTPTHKHPCSPFHHTSGSLLTFSSHMGILAHLFITRVGIPGLCPLEVVGDWVWAKLGWSSLLTLGLHMMILHLLILTLLMHQRAWSFPSMPLSMVFLGKQHTEHHGKPQRLESHTLLAHRRVLPLLHFLRMLHKPEIQRCWNKNCQVLFHKILIGL